MNVVELPIELLKQRARAGDREALQTLRDRGAFPASRLPLECPASWAQQRMWIAAEKVQPGLSYAIALARRVRGRLDEEALREAVTALQRRHETLRTRFAERDGMLVQIVDPPGSADLTVLDFRDAANPEAACHLRLAALAREPIDLRAGPAWRACLCRLGATDHVIGLVVHHIIADAWSLEILQHDLVCLYQRSPVLAPLTSQYRHFAASQRAADSEQELAASQRYWREQLADAPGSLALPFDFAPRATDSHAGTSLQMRIDELRLSALRRLAADRGVTLFAALQATVKVLLHRYCHEIDIVVGTPVAGREFPDAEHQIGLFINLLALRDRLDPDAGFDQLLEETARTVEDALAHRKYPFDRLVAEIAAARRGSDAPLFNVFVTLQNIAPQDIAITDLAVSDFSLGAVFAEHDLAFEFAEHNGELALTLVYRTARFTSATIERMSRHYGRLLEGIIADPSMAIAELPLLDGAEQAALAKFNATGRDYRGDRGIAAVFGERVAAQPQARALSWWDGELDYAGLEAQANRLAHHLRAKIEALPGVSAAQPVIAVYLERSPELVVALLGVLKAGAAYLPLDAQEPAERLGFMLSDAGAVLVVSTRELSDHLPAGHPALVLLDEEAAAIAARPESAPPCAADGKSLAYVMYTSGSTGQPKGVCIAQRAVLRLAFADYVQVGPGDCIAQAANAAFDALTFEIWGALLNGAAVHVLRREEVLDPARFADQLRAGRFNTLFLTTALFNRFAALDPSLFAALDVLLFGGEAVDPGSVAAVLAHGRPRLLLHVYGPTESTTFATSYEVETIEPGAATVPIGRPLSNTTAHVLDPLGAPVPIGVAGELHIGGDGLATVYLNRPELTAERFIVHPQFGRLYRTGDLCRRLADGNLVFLGRLDQQIKLRGFRIEPGEIEAHLRREAGVKDAAVIVLGEGEHRRLVAYVTGPALPDVELLRQRLRRALPEPMVPGRIVPLSELPLTANGKLDRSRLPEPVEDNGAAVAAATPTEELVASIWSAVLGRESVGRGDNFFDLGGHSLLAMQLVARLRENLGVELPLRVLFEHPVLHDLAAAVDASQRTPLPPLQPLAPLGASAELPLSFAQQRLWFLSQLRGPGDASYNVTAALRLDGALDEAALRQALWQLTARQASLRMNIRERGGEPLVVVGEPYDPLAAVIDLGDVAAPEREAAIARHAEAHGSRPFDLARDRLLRLSLLRLGEQEFVLLFAIHHIVADGWSLGVVVRELGALYAAASAGGDAGLPALEVQYTDYSAWQRGWLQGEVLAQELAHWRAELSGAPALLNLPADFARPAVKSYRGAQHGQQLAAELTAGLKRLSRSQGATLYMTLLAAFDVLLQRYSGESDVVVGTPIAGRTQRVTEPLVGFFVNTLALRVQLSGDQPFTDVLAEVRRKALSAYAHQELPFEVLVNELQPQRSLSSTPLFQVMFALQNAPVGEVRLGEVEARPLWRDPGTAKFDLTLSLIEQGDGLAAVWEYSTDLFTSATIERMSRHYGRLLEGIIADPSMAIAELPLLDGAEQAALAKFNATGRDYRGDRGIAAVFGERVAAQPQARALSWWDGELDYAGLEAQANRLAHHLRAKIEALPGVSAAQPVIAVYLERSPELVVALLGVLKAGAAYLPLDAQEPAERLGFMLSDAGAVLVVSTRELSDHLPAGHPALVLLDEEAAAIAARPESAPPCAADGKSLAYVMYTSGSTGQPKGVCIAQRAVLRLAFADYVQVGPGDCIAQAANAAFDALTFEIWGALLNGAAVHVLRREEVLDPARFADQLRAGRFNTLFLTTALFNRFAALDPSLFAALDVLLFGGEAVDPGSVAAVLAHGRPRLLLHVYGPTESTTFATSYEVETIEPGAATVPIGRPLSNTTAHVLDPLGAPVPIGVAGELHIGGDGLATVYLNRPELTAERFIVHPQFGRLYRTGDLCRRLADGNLVFLGRLDQQIKLRGFRIEPGEIEAHLRREAGVKDAAVIVLGEGEHRRLVAYVTGPALPDVELLRQRLRRALPEPMVPGRIVPLSELPLTANGKLDRSRLPEPVEEENETFESPLTLRETKLAAIWSSVLGRERIGRHDNFFALGGDSILSIQIIARARQQGFQFAVNDLFRYQTVAELAAAMEDGHAAPDAAAAPPGTLFPLTPIQNWFFEQDPVEPSHFNQAILQSPRESLAMPDLREALAAIMEQHAALRLRFRETAEGWMQTYAAPAGDLPLHEEDLRQLPPHDQSAALTDRASHWQRSMDLVNGPMTRLVLFHLADGQRLLWCAHHLCVDAVSWRILLGDLEEALVAIRHAAPPRLAPASAAFSVWGQFLQELAASPDVRSEAAHWLQLDNAANVPLDHPLAISPPFASSRHCSIRLRTDDTRALLEQAQQAYGTRINDLLLTALALALARWSGLRRIAVDLEGHGRFQRPGAPDVSSTVGWFTQIHPLELALPATDDLGACIKAIKEQVRAAPSEGMSYALLRYATPPAVPDRTAPISFNYLGQLDGLERGGLLALAGEDAGESRSRHFRRTRPIDIDAMVLRGEAVFTISYSSEQFFPETIEKLGTAYRAALEELITHCCSGVCGYTPSDFPLARLEPETLDDLAARYRGAIADIYPLSPMQLGMLFHSLYADRSSAYVEQIHFRIEGQLDPARFRAAWQALIARHPILRTVFLSEVSPPVQIVFDQVEASWHAADWRGWSGTEQSCALEQLLAQEHARGFDLARAPLMRFHLVRLDEDCWRFVWCFHHVLLDGWSMPILFQELLALYGDVRAVLPPRQPFRDYVAWLQQQDHEAARSHWRGYLAGFTAPTPLPLAQLPATDAESHVEAAFVIDTAATREVVRFAGQQRFTLSSVLQAAWALTLHRYCGDTDVVFGVTVSGRDIDLPDVDGMIGLLINTLPLRARLDERPLRQWIRTLQAEQQENRRCGFITLADIQACSPLASGTKLFDSVLVFENYPTDTSVQPASQHGLRITDVTPVDHTSFPLALIASAGNRIQLRIGYDARRFERPAIERLFKNLRATLTAIARVEPSTPVSMVAVLDPTEEREIAGWSKARAPRGCARTLIEMFGDQVRRDPDRPAVVTDREQLTYGELDARARRLATRLRAIGAGPDRVVGLCADRSIEMIVGLLGILHSGAAYLPLEAALPPTRLQFMLEDAAAIALVTTPGVAAPSLGVPIPCLVVDADEGDAADGADLGAGREPELQHLAYVLYTSGSTGQPKGVMVTHGNVARLFTTTQATFRFSPDDVWTLFHSFAFDFSVWEMWGALLHGGRLVVVPYDVSRDPHRFHDMLERHGVTVLNQTPSAFRQMIPVAEAAGRGLALRLVIFGGEALDLPSLRPWFALYGDERPQLVNMYGITETTVHVTWLPLRSSDTECTANLIGRPLDDLDLFVVDRRGLPVPVGGIGEILVGGAGVARGYLNRSDLTAQRFIEATLFGAQRRLYRSGDLARWRSDGTLEYLGRSDHQVKLRGHRIELGEIEAQLSLHPGIRQAAVAPYGVGAAQYLAAYLVPRESGAVPQVLHAWLAARLPRYMIPARFIEMDRLPLTANGKLDRLALPDPTEAAAPRAAEYVAPRSELEGALARIWAEALGSTGIGIHDDFFAIGGHSLIALQVASRIHRNLGIRIPLRWLFEHTTIAALAPILASAGPSEALGDIPLMPRQAHYPLSHAQQRLWIDHQAAGASNYNMPEAYLFEDRLDVEALARAIAALVDRHEILRTHYLLVDGELRQSVLDQLQIVLREEDLANETAVPEKMQAIIDAEAGAPFDLAAPPLLRFTVVRQPASRDALIIVMHHIVGDGWSRAVLHRELSLLYDAFRHGRANPLAPLRIQYKDYAAWDATCQFEREERYWLANLAGAPTRIALDHNFAPSGVELMRGSRRERNLGPDIADGLRRLTLRHSTSLSNIVLALFKLLLFRTSGQQDICLGMIFANRNHPEIEGLIGFFVNVLPIRTQLTAEMEFSELLGQVTTKVQEALDHASYPFDRLVRHLDRAGGSVVRPFLDVIYAFQSGSQVHVDIGVDICGTPRRPLESLDFAFPFAKAELCLNVCDHGRKGIGLTLEYDSALFAASTVDGYLDALEQFAKSVIAWSES